MTDLSANQNPSPHDEIAILKQEITQLKQENKHYLETLKILQEKERLLQLVLDNIPQLIFWKDKNSVFQGCNRLWAKAAGFNHPNDVIGKTDYELYPNDQKVEVYIETDRQVITSGKPIQIQEYKPNKDVWYDTKKIPMQDHQGNIVGILATIEDITQHKKAEELLRKQVEELRIEIDQQKRERQVTEITQTAYFKELQSELDSMRFDEEDF